MEYSNLPHLSKRTGIEPALLQYCLDQELVPQSEWLGPEEAVEGRLDFETAIFVAAAAVLVHAGCRPETVRRFLYEIGRIHPVGRKGTMPLVFDAIKSAEPTSIQIADYTHVRCKIGTRDSGWVGISSGTHERDLNFAPRAVIALDIGMLRDLVRG
jgi:hypothetical protein